MTRLYVDVHVLQTVPPSNLNRDDAGAPKQAVYGGARRARVSSQAWKRATRKSFGQADSGVDLSLGTRTRRRCASCWNGGSPRTVTMPRRRSAGP